MNAETVDDDLSLVMAELTVGVGARASAVLFDAGDGRVRMLHAHDPAAAIDRLLGDAAGAIDAVADRLEWLRSGDEDLLLAPLYGGDARGRVVIAMTFDRLEPERRRAAELAFARAAPVAGACLRLWLARRAGAAAVRSLHAALDWSGLGVVLLDGGGEIVFANHAARGMLDAGDGLRRSGNRVVTCDLGDTVRLQLAIEHVTAVGESDVAAAADRHAAPLLAIGRAGAPALMLSVLPTASVGGDAAAILYVMDPARDMGELLRPVCRAYRLSPTEALLARHLVAGDTIAAAAVHMGVKAMTARGYLKQIFLKTGTHRQPELVQLMLSSIIHTHPGPRTVPSQADRLPANGGRATSESAVSVP